MNHNIAQEQPVVITRTEITDENQRLEALPRHFGNYFYEAEQLVYAWMSNLCKEYQGAYWGFYELSNGGFYMAPKLKDPLLVESFGWQCTVHMSADAAGLCACLFTVGQLISKTNSEWPIDLYHNIRDYALSHPEIDAIWKVID